MSVEIGQLSMELAQTKSIRDQYRPLKIVNAWGKLIDKTTDTKAKKVGGFVGMMGVVALSMAIDGNFALASSEALAVVGGATVGEKIPFVSWLPDRIKEKRELANLRQKKEVRPEEIAKLLEKFSDVVEKEEVVIWPSKKMGEESHERPKRYRIMRAVLENNPENEELVVDKFMEAQAIAQKSRGTKKTMNKEMNKKLLNIGAGILLFVGTTNFFTFGLGYQSQAAIIGLGDDVIFWSVLIGSFCKQKIKSFFVD